MLRKPKGQSGINNPETQAILGTRTRRKTAKIKDTTQKTKKKNNKARPTKQAKNKTRYPS